MHKWFSATDCPGAYLEGKFPWITDQVNKILNGESNDKNEAQEGREESMQCFYTVDGKGPVIWFDGQKVEPSKLGDALKKGIAFVSEDRRGVGLLLGESILQNIVFTAMQIQGKFLKKIGPISQFDAKAARQHALDMIQALDIRCTGPDQYAGRLSGGNQQKVCLARAITMEPKLLIVSEPTRGIDIGAKKLVLEMLAKMNREQGMTIIMVSSELNELRSLCDRIAIVSDGKLTGIFGPDASDAEYGLAMSGVMEGDKHND